MTLPNKEFHEQTSWVLTRKRISEGLNLINQLVRGYILEFTCQECGNKYPKIAEKDVFDEAIVGKTTW